MDIDSGYMLVVVSVSVSIFVLMLKLVLILGIGVGIVIGSGVCIIGIGVGIGASAVASGSIWQYLGSSGGIPAAWTKLLSAHLSSKDPPKCYITNKYIIQ